MVVDDPGVTNLPLPSITVAPAGTSTDAPTATITPSFTRIVPLATTGPAAVSSVAFRIANGGAAGAL